LPQRSDNTGTSLLIETKVAGERTLLEYVDGGSTEPRQYSLPGTGKLVLQLMINDANSTVEGGWVNADYIKFDRLKNSWLREIEPAHKLHEIFLLPSYQKIIGMGKQAVPFLFHELRTTPNWWFYALSMILEIDPTSAVSQGNLTKLTAEWLAWAKEYGY
jgi:hypothetical protein